MQSSEPTISQLIDTLKYATFIHFPSLDAQYFLPGCTAAEISGCESLLGEAIPCDVWDLWSESGGEEGSLGVIMGARFLQWRQSIQMMLDFPAYFTDPGLREELLLPLFVDDSMHALIAVRLGSADVVIMSLPDTMNESANPIVINTSLKEFLVLFIKDLLDNEGFYEALPYCQYRVLVGTGSYIRHRWNQKSLENNFIQSFASQSLI